MSAAASPDSPVYMLTAARWWATLGMPVFPLHYPVPSDTGLVCSCGKTCASPAKHPMTPNGFEDATVDTDVIDKWWHRHPHANIGIRTGIVFDLFDVDGEQGFASLAALTAQLGGEPASSLIVESGRVDGGRHYYMQPAGKKSLAGGLKGVPVGLDVKGVGGYAVAAPSQHISGTRYRLISQTPTGTVPWDSVYAALTANRPAERPAVKNYVPDPLATTPAVDGKDGDTPYGLKALAGMCVQMRAQRQPGRDTLLNDLCVRAGTLIRDSKLTRDTAERELQQAAYSVTDASFTRAQIDEKLARSIDDGISGTYQIKYGPPPAGRSYTQAESDSEPWESPDTLELGVPDFPTHTLGWMQGAVEALADELQTPVDIIGMLLLATVAATVRGRADVQVKGRWREPLNLYVAVIAGAGETKSPALAVISRPLRDIEAELHAAALPEVSKNEQARRIQKARLDKAEKAASGADLASRYSKEIDADEARRIYMEMPEANPPRLLAADATPEGLVQLLAQQKGVLAVLSAEGGLFDTLAGGRYSSGMANLDAVLQAHDGREPIIVDRKGSPPIRVARPCLTLGLAVQPQVIAAVGKSDAAVGRGFLARFLYSVPVTRVGSRRVTEPTIEASFEDFEDVIRRIDLALGKGSEDFEDVSPKVNLKLSSSSLEAFYAYRESLEPRRHPATGDLAAVRAWANKLDGQIARLAGLLQLIYNAEHPQNPQNSNEVAPATLIAALDLAEYLIGHAVAAHLLMRGEALAVSDGAVQLLGWVRKNAQPTFTLRDAHQALRGRLDFQHPENVMAAAQILIDAGHLRRVVPEKNTPGRPSTRYLVNPAVLPHEESA